MYFDTSATLAEALLFAFMPGRSTRNSNTHLPYRETGHTDALAWSRWWSRKFEHKAAQSRHVWLQTTSYACALGVSRK